MPECSASRSSAAEGAARVGPHHLQSTTTGVATSSIPVPDAAHITYYNCSKQGHVQADCTDEPFGLKCKKVGHLSAMRASFSRGSDPYWAGFGCGQKGFFCCEVPEEEMHQPVANAATVIIEDKNQSEEEVDAELKDLVDETWDWQVRKLNETDFLVVFPSKESLRMAIRGGGPTLPTSKCKALVMVPTGDPLAVEQLEEIWVRLHGVPPPFRHADRLLMTTREIGRPVGDYVSRLKEKLPSLETLHLMPHHPSSPKIKVMKKRKTMTKPTRIAGTAEGAATALEKSLRPRLLREEQAVQEGNRWQWPRSSVKLLSPHALPRLAARLLP
ncbi:hypothetical protein QYE76_057647 [Lolium multiflorum]|uniref:CCHC-type domain-containing protein n=1 Tax=Lolium multiflorum TaxID=4521 RepID=A0AAD8WQV4_LOLMU|nr:hypothetical protein QYE76_057647 [Lolium multiflorum]